MIDREKLVAALRKSLGDAYYCTRVWEAWGYGTMTSRDFEEIDCERVAEEIIEELKP